MIKETNKHYDKSEIEPQTRGRGKEILINVGGANPESLDGKHQKCIFSDCPGDGGKDRFRAIDPDNGILYCNQCFYEKNGDIFAAVQRLLNCSFSDAVNKVGEYLDVTHSQPVKKREPTPKKKTTSFNDQVQFLETDQGDLKSWVEQKKPATVEAAEAAGARLVEWPKKAPQGNRFKCVAFPAFLETNKPAGWILYRVNGANFPAIPNGPGERKTHLLRGSVDGWVLFGGRSAVEAAHTIVKCEGVLDQLAISPHLPDGYAPVTNTHGAKSAKNCPVDIFAGKRVVIIGDADKPGVSGANSLAQEIVPYVSEVKVIIPDGEVSESNGKDIRDVMNENYQTGIGHQETVDALIQKAENEPEYQVPGNELAGNGPEEYESIPIDCFPSVIGNYGKQSADSIGCDPSFTLLPLLIAIGSLIGNKRCLYYSTDYQLPPIIWGAVVASSGTGKSPGFNAALRPMFKLQAFIEEQNREAFAQYEKDCLSYEVESKEWKQKLKKDDSIPPDEPEKPEPPAVKAYTIDDSTAEATVSILNDNPNGILQQKDELSGLFADFDKYSKAKGSDAAMYLKAYDGTPLQIHRKGNRKPVFIPKPLISLVGGIQPGILKQTLSNGYRQNGMVPRFVFAYPPERPLPYPSTQGTPESTRHAIEQLFESLCNLRPYEVREDGSYIPKRIYLSDGARDVYKGFYENNRDEWFFKNSLERSAWSKFNQIVFRFALIFHCVENAVSGKDRQQIGTSTMTNAVRLAEWFKKETLRVYKIFDTGGESEETPQQQQNNRLMEFIKDKGGTVSVREVQRGMNFKKADETEKALNEIVKSGVAKWVDKATKKQGRPARSISLRHYDKKTQSPKTSVLARSVIDDAENEPVCQENQNSETTEQQRQEAPENLGDFMDFIDDEIPFQ